MSPRKWTAPWTDAALAAILLRLLMIMPGENKTGAPNFVSWALCLPHNHISKNLLRKGLLLVQKVVKQPA